MSSLEAFDIVGYWALLIASGPIVAYAVYCAVQAATFVLTVQRAVPAPWHNVAFYWVTISWGFIWNGIPDVITDGRGRWQWKRREWLS